MVCEFGRLRHLCGILLAVFGLVLGHSPLAAWASGPGVVSLNPTTLTTAAGSASTLAATYTNGGVSPLTKVQFCVGTNGYPSTTLYAEYLPPSNLLYLFNPSDTAIGGFSPGSNNVITTSLGSLNCAATSVSSSGNDLTVNWNITPTTSLEGTQYTYLEAEESGTSSGWTGLGSWTIAASGPSPASLTPASLSTNAGSASTLTAIYADSAGYTALTKVQFCVGTNGAPSSTLYAEYIPATNQLYLFNSSDTAIGGFTPGSANVITTTLGSLDCAGTTVSGSGSELTVNWDITPAAALSGKQYTYLQAEDGSASSNWTGFGTWTIAVPGPTVVSLSPTSISSYAGTSETVTSTYADTGGFGALTKVQLCVGTNGSPASSLYAAYLPATNQLYLYNANNQAVGGFTPGSNSTISTTLGSLNCAGTTIETSGDNLTVAWAIAPSTSLTGTQNTYLQAADSGATTAFTYFGNWTITAPGPQLVSVTPVTLNSSANAAGTLTATYADSGGYSALTQVQLCVGNNEGPSGSIYAQYRPATNALYLYNANDVAVGGYAPGSNNVISTNLASLNCASTTVTKSGDELIVAWSITPATFMDGARTTYIQASDANTSTVFVGFGTWNISAPGPSNLSISPTSLSSTAGNQESITTAYADANGFSALTQVQFCVGTNGSPSTTLYASYLPQNNQLFLYNSSNVAVGGFTPGSDNVITTSLGTLNCARTSVSESGNNLTVTWSITPATALEGKQYTYLQAADDSEGTPWEVFGSWTISASTVEAAGPSGAVSGVARPSGHSS